MINFTAEIDARLSDFGPRLYSLDLGIGRSGKFWIYELNTMPGIVWDDQLPQDRALRELMHGAVARWMDAVLVDNELAPIESPESLAAGTGFETHNEEGTPSWT